MTRAYASDDLLDEALEQLGGRRPGILQQLAADGPINWKEIFRALIKALLPLLLDLLGGISIPTSFEGEASSAASGDQWEAICTGLRASKSTGCNLSISPAEASRILEAMGVV